MHLQRLFFHSYRNIEKAEFHPHEGFNIFWGDNAQGKTNLLEGIYLLGTLKSFRGARNPDLVQQGKESARISGELDRNGSHRRIDLSITPQGKAPKIDGKDVRSASEYFGFLHPVLFSPEEIALAKGPPAGRRSLIDRALFQADLSFLQRARDYERHLRQRNVLLREGRGEGEIAPWTEGLIRAGARLRADRRIYLDAIDPFLKESYRNITGGSEGASLHYPTEHRDVFFLEEDFRRELERVAHQERRVGQTLAGPHKDDPIFLIEGRTVKTFGSQGQQRSFLLSFKTAQILDLERRTGEPPLLLLDDMTGELDRRRQSFFFSFLLARKGQVFITTTETRPLIDQGFATARFFKIEKGRVLNDCIE